jgi:hypothetical protein
MSALSSNTSGQLNTATGHTALSSNTEGTNNTATGARALLSNTKGAGNTATGFEALLSNTEGVFNTANGHLALQENTFGSDNTAIGFLALSTNTIGGENIATGSWALRLNTTGSRNTAAGRNALISNTTGNYNTATGYGAGLFNVTGSNNTYLGYLSGPLTETELNNATAIGNGAKVNASNKVRLGNSAVTVLESQVGLTVMSDRNAKENFHPVDAEGVLRKISKLSVPSWNYIGHDPKAFRHYGPMAQDFFAAFGDDEIGQIGSPTTINSSDMAGILMLAVQALEKRSTDQQKDNEALRRENHTLELQLKKQQELFQAEEERIRRLETLLHSLPFHDQN